MDKLDRFKRANNYPSYSQAVTILVERQGAKTEATEEVSKKVAEEASKVFARLLYELAFGIARKTNKPIRDITLDDILTAVKSMEP